MVKAQLLALTLAFLIDLVFGELPNSFHPVTFIGRFIRVLSRKWNHGSPQKRFWMGTLMTILGIVVFSAPFVLIIIYGKNLPWWTYGALTGILLKPCFALRALLQAGQDVFNALRRDDLNEARRLVAWHLVSRDTSGLNEGEISSAVVESLAENLTDSLATPLFCFAFIGLPLVWACRFVNTADAMIGYRTEEWEQFGKFSARLDDIVNFLPARMAGISLVLASFLCGADWRSAARVMRRDHRETLSPNAGWTMASLAGALGKRLEKKNAYALYAEMDLPDRQDILRAKRIVFVSGVLNWLLSGGIIIGLAGIL